MNKRLLIGIFSLLLILSFGILVQAKSPYVIDEGNLLSEKEEEKLAQMIDKINEREGINLVVLTVQSLEGKTVGAYADDYYDEHQYLSDGTLLLISEPDRVFHISTSGRVINILHDQALEDMIEQLVPHLSAGNYNKGIQSFVKNSDFLLKTGGEKRLVAPKKITLFEGLMSSLFGILGSSAILFGMYKTHQSVSPKAYADEYYDPNTLRFTRAKDYLMYTHISKSLRQTSNSSGGNYSSRGATTHTSSSGTSHGGRSGHF